jgi:hypothetical protein
VLDPFAGAGILLLADGRTGCSRAQASGPRVGVVLNVSVRTHVSSCPNPICPPLGRFRRQDAVLLRHVPRVGDNASESSSRNTRQRRQRMHGVNRAATLLHSSTKQSDDPVGAPSQMGGRTGSPGDCWHYVPERVSGYVLAASLTPRGCGQDGEIGPICCKQPGNGRFRL